MHVACLRPAWLLFAATLLPTRFQATAASPPLLTTRPSPQLTSDTGIHYQQSHVPSAGGRCPRERLPSPATTYPPVLSRPVRRVLAGEVFHWQVVAPGTQQGITVRPVLTVCVVPLGAGDTGNTGWPSTKPTSTTLASSPSTYTLPYQLQARQQHLDKHQSYHALIRIIVIAVTSSRHASAQ